VARLPELLATGAGLPCRPGDEADLANKIVQLMEDESLCRRAATAAARLAYDSYTPQRHMTDLEDVYTEIASST